MKHKIPPIEVTAEDPFENDALNRDPAVESLAALIDNLMGPFVLAINSPWGTGKTTFIKMLQRILEKREYKCLYFDAWKTDYSTDPLIAFLGELATNVTDLKEAKGVLKKDYDKIKKIGTLLTKESLQAAVKFTTAGAVDIKGLAKQMQSELAKENKLDFIDAYLEEKKLRIEFRTSLEALVGKLTKKGEKKKIIIFVDELDRCRPTYAIDLLERIKHLFDIPNIIFLLSLDKLQLDVSLNAVYGSGINSDEYLRRFIDLEFLLHKPDAEAYTKNLFDRFDFGHVFMNRKVPDAQYEAGGMIATFNGLSNIFELSLRAREQCFSRISVALLATPDTHFLHPSFLAALVILREASQTLYKRYALEDGSASEFVEFIRSKAGGDQFLQSQEGIVLEAYFIAAKRDTKGVSSEFAEYSGILEDPAADKKTRDRAGRIIAIATTMSNRRNLLPLQSFINKIELASQFQK